MKLVVTTLMGVEALVGEELRGLGYPAESVSVQNARVVLDAGDDYAAACARVNLWTRYGERVLLELGQAPAPDFDALFDATRALPGEPTRSKPRWPHAGRPPAAPARSAANPGMSSDPRPLPPHAKKPRRSSPAI